MPFTRSKIEYIVISDDESPITDVMFAPVRSENQSVVIPVEGGTATDARPENQSAVIPVEGRTASDG
jgi:hypothetical protein